MSGSIFVISPSCVTLGKCFRVIDSGNGSISLDQIGSIPARVEASNHPPMPSKKLPSVKCFFNLLPPIVSFS